MTSAESNLVAHLRQQLLNLVAENRPTNELPRSAVRLPKRLFDLLTNTSVDIRLGQVKQILRSLQVTCSECNQTFRLVLRKSEAGIVEDDPAVPLPAKDIRAAIESQLQRREWECPACDITTVLSPRVTSTSAGLPFRFRRYAMSLRIILSESERPKDPVELPPGAARLNAIDYHQRCQAPSCRERCRPVRSRQPRRIFTAPGTSRPGPHACKWYPSRPRRTLQRRH
jgi:hypothetical protein